MHAGSLGMSLLEGLPFLEGAYWAVVTCAAEALACMHSQGCAFTHVRTPPPSHLATYARKHARKQALSHTHASKHARERAGR
eukprot:6213580-Pleurochrysis_carterae.AAC.1